MIPPVDALADLFAPLEDAARWRWLSLAERRAVLPERLPPIEEGHRRRLDYWRRRAGLGDEARFAARLAAEGCDAATFAWSIAHDPPPGIGAAPASARRALPTLRAALARGETPLPAPIAAMVEALPFLPVLRPLIAHAAEALAAAGLPETLAAAEGEGALGALARRLHLTAARALVLDLNVARVRGALAGADAAARYRGFVERPGAFAALVRGWPLLGRLLAEAVDCAVAAASALWARWTADRAALVAAGLAPAEEAPVFGLFDLSDPHAGQQSVVELRFAGGARLMYKPRPLAVDVAFAGLLDRLAALGMSPPLAHVRVLDRGGYGWVEYVAAAPCADAAGVARFFRRQGALLAVLQAVGGADVHNENLIARGEVPVVVDAECLFVSDLPLFGERVAPLDRHLLRSVFLPGLLPLYTAHGGVEIGGLGGRPGQVYAAPMPVWVERESDAMRMGARAAELPPGANRVTGPDGPADVLDHLDALVGGYVDAGRLLIGARAALLAGPAWAALGAAPTRFLARPTAAYGTRLYDATHPDYLRSGADRDLAFEPLFAAAWDADTALAAFVPAERAAMWGGDVPLFRVRPDDTRVEDAFGVAVPVRLAESTFAELTARLGGWDEATVAEGVRHIRGAFAALAESLAGEGEGIDGIEGVAVGARAADDGSDGIDRMASEPGSPGVTAPDDGSDGIDRASSDPRPPVDVIDGRGRATPDDGDAAIAAGAQAASGSLPSIDGIGRSARAARLRPESRPPVAVDASALLTGAVGIGDRLLGLATCAGGEATWHGFMARAGDRWSYEPCEPYLYDGDAGIALFLGALAAETRVDRFAGMAEAAVAYVIRRFERQGVDGSALGGFGGWPSAAYALMRLAAALDRPAWVDAAVEMVAACAPAVAADRQLDVLGGVAGAGIVAARLAARTGDRRLEALGRAVRDRLLVAPAIGGAGEPLLAGLSHGAAGFAWALDALRRWVGGGEERIAALLAYERGVFDAASGNWRDLRPRSGGDPVGLVAWCHGAAGVGLGRLAMGAASDEAAGVAPMAASGDGIAGEIEAALATTRARGRLRAQCLCHGSLGNAELLLSAGLRQGRPALVAEARGWGGAVLAAMAAAGEPFCGLPFVGVAQPGLMTGLAGVGYGLLRLARPEAVPAVLLLEG